MQFRGALAGAGFFAQFHAEAWSRIPGARILAVADPDGARAEEFARRWNIPAAYASAEEMLDRERPDFLDIVTRPETHRALALAAASRRIHVICQKPMAPSQEECRDMVRACAEAGVRLVVHENWRWQPWYREARRLVDAGECGRVFYLGFRMRTGDGRGPAPYPAQPYFRDMPRLLIYETLIHFLDTFRFLAGEIASVYCTTRRVNPIIAGEDCAVIQVRFANGADGLIDANRISGPPVPEATFGELRIEGDRGMIRMTPDGDLRITRYGESERPHPFDKPATGYKGDSVLSMQRHFIECLATGRPAESEGKLYLETTMAAVEACYRSAASGNPEPLG